MTAHPVRNDGAPRPANDGARPSKFDRLDAWQADPANREAVTAAARKAKCRLKDCAAVLRVLVTATRPDGRVSKTHQQVADALWMDPATVKRAVAALTAAGVLVTEMSARSPGRNGGPGRAAVRRVTILEPVAASGMTAHYGLNDGAPECTALRGESTEPPTTPVHNFDRAAATARRNERTRNTGTDPTSALVARTAEWLCTLQQQQRGNVVNPTAWAMHKRTAVADTLTRLQQHPTASTRERWQTAPHLVDPAAVHIAVTALAAYTDGEQPNPATIAMIDRAILEQHAAQPDHQRTA